MRCRPRALSRPRLSGLKEVLRARTLHHGSPSSQSSRGTHLLLVLAFGIPCLVVGCGDGDAKPKPTDAATGDKMQKYMSNYGDQMKAANKAKAAVKKTPAATKGP